MDSYIDGNPYHESNNKITSNILELWQGKISNIPLVCELYRWYMNRWWERQATVRKDMGSTSVQRTREGVYSTHWQKYVPRLISLCCTQQCQDKHTVKNEAGEEKEIIINRVKLSWCDKNIVIRILKISILS